MGPRRNRWTAVSPGKRYKSAMIRKRRNQKETPTLKTEVFKILNWQLGTYSRKPSEQQFEGIDHCQYKLFK